MTGRNPGERGAASTECHVRLRGDSESEVATQRAMAEIREVPVSPVCGWRDHSCLSSLLFPHCHSQPGGGCFAPQPLPPAQQAEPSTQNPSNGLSLSSSLSPPQQREVP